MLLVISTVLPSCSEADSPGDGTIADVPPSPEIAVADTGPCTVLFGLPNDKTGLTDDQCQPLCNCEGKHFIPPAYTESTIAGIEAMVFVGSVPQLNEDPYEHPELHEPEPGTVCGVLPDPSAPGAYTLETFDGVEAAVAGGAAITHDSACGVCSPLNNLVVYMRQPDLTDPVRECGIQGMLEGMEANIQCLMGLGFDEQCALIWYYNTRHTRQECGAICLAQLDDPYHHPDGTLNDCLLCDEEKSGPVFKAVAGRTRRNTGLPSSMCRPCSEVLPIVHDYL